jgi:ribosome-associated toxin RatA of RatAB toxin-antitoxin module
MADVQKTVLIRHSAEQMFDLVTDVADYPNFLPWCGGVEIHHQDEASMDAKIHINFKGIRQHFSTHNSQQRPTRIDMAFTDGPFKKFTGSWRFTPLREDACKIEFALHYEFSNFLLEKIIGPVFHHIANTFVESFVKRADQIHGKS